MPKESEIASLSEPFDLDLGGACRYRPASCAHLAISPNGRFLAFGRDDTLEIWSLRARQVVRRVTGHPVTDVDLRGLGRGIGVVGISSNGRWIVTVFGDYYDASVLLWNTETGRQVFCLPIRSLGSLKEFGQAAVSDEGDILIVSINDDLDAHGGTYTVQCWGPHRNELAWSWRGREPARSWGLIMASENQLVVQQTNLGDTVLRALKDGRELRQWKTGYNIYGWAMSRNGKRLATSGWDCAVRLWSIDTAIEIFSTVPGDGSGEDLRPPEVTISPDGRQVLASSPHGHLKLLDSRGETLWELFAPEYACWDLRAPAVGEWILIGRVAPHHIRLWQLSA